MIKAYLANGLFSEADQMYNSYLADRLHTEFPWMDLYVPQDNPALNDKMGYANSEAIFHGDNAYLDDADILIAVLDGIEIDSGVSAEIGRFALLRDLDIQNHNRTNRYVFGLYTDVRQQGTSNQKKIEALIHGHFENQFAYRNLYTVGAVKANGIISQTSDQLIETIHYMMPYSKPLEQLVFELEEV